MNRRVFIITGVCGIGATALLALSGSVRSWAYAVFTRLRGRATVEERLAELNPRVRDQLQSRFAEVGAPYPPHGVVLLGLKQERLLELHARDDQGATRLIRQYPILAASGAPGPKLREGDRQVPEGVYRAVSLNPNSQFHLSIELDYPNAFDRNAAAKDGRTQLGGDIFIHGGSASIGCLAMGDPAIEELFTLLAEVGLDNVEVILAPLDLRRHELPAELRGGWRDELYDDLNRRLAEFPDH